MTTIVIIAALLFLACLTFWLNKENLRVLRRWHLHYVSNLPYRQGIEIILLSFQLCLIFGYFLFLWSKGESTSYFASFLGQGNFDWRFFCFLILYILALIEVTMFVLIGLIEVVFKIDSRATFQKMTWLAFTKQQPLTSILFLLLTTLTDAAFYFGIVHLSLREERWGFLLTVLSFAVVKACSFKGNPEKIVAFLLFLNIGIWCMVATLLYSWFVGMLLLGLTYMIISFKEQHR